MKVFQITETMLCAGGKKNKDGCQVTSNMKYVHLILISLSSTIYHSLIHALIHIFDLLNQREIAVDLLLWMLMENTFWLEMSAGEMVVVWKDSMEFMEMFHTLETGLTPPSRIMAGQSSVVPKDHIMKPLLLLNDKRC